VSRVRLTVPGNILLLGEYAVLEEGGRGLAMAVDTRVRLEAFPADSLVIQSAWAGRSFTWTPGQGGEHPLLEAAVSVVEDWLRGRAGSRCAAKVRIDSSDFFSPDGRKSGLGSSAAVSVALVCGLLDAAGARAEARGPEACRLALRAHRRAQGGRGSGYDVMASFHGGVGIFRGGEDPSWEPCRLPGRPEVLLFPGHAPVSTSAAVGRYAEWKQRSPGAARDFLQKSNEAILSFTRSGSAEQSLPWFGACRKLGVELGTSIGVPAEMDCPPGLDPRWSKALGAGNELGLCLLPLGAPRPAASDFLRQAREAAAGVTWEE
jgi:phosphomevalonate kinase